VRYPSEFPFRGRKIMRAIALLIVFTSLSVVGAQEGEGKKANPAQEQQKIPTTLAEAHAELERGLSPETLAEIDALPSEAGTARYHMDVGLWMRNRWLWRGSLLRKQMEESGFTHPDDMSAVILATFWRKRHGQDVRLEELAAAQRKAIEDERRAEEERKIRIRQAKVKVREIMMGLRCEPRDVPTVEIPTRSGLSVTFLCPFRDGVFLTTCCPGRLFSSFDTDADRDHADPPDGEIRRPIVYDGRLVVYDDTVVRGRYSDEGFGPHRIKPPDEFYTLGGYFFSQEDDEAYQIRPGDDFYTQGFYLDLRDCEVRRVRVPEVNEVYAAVVVGGRAWFAGLTDGKAVLVGVGDRDRIVLPLPQDDEIPELGMDGSSLLAVYSRTIYRLTEGQWTLVHCGDVLFPRSVPPPQRYGNMVFVQDISILDHHKPLRWLNMDEPFYLHTLHQDVGVLDAWGPYWGEVLSYCITNSGDLWACVGGWNATSLVRRSRDGSYAIAVLKGRLQFPEDLPDSSRTDQRLSISAVTPLSDDTLLLAGRSGLYRLKGNELVQELAFDAHEAPNRLGRCDDRDWTPSHVLMLDDGSYVIGTTLWDGVYLLRKGKDGRWNGSRLDADSSDSFVL
jgi:hypothetical protein